jgi:thiamine biosynthesis lipoprotein
MTISVLTPDPGALGAAESLLRSDLEELDRACSRFRAGSEISRVEGAGGATVPISPLLNDLVAAAIQVATHGRRR